MAKKAVQTSNQPAPARAVSMANLDPDGQYRIKLNRAAKHGNDLLRPRDDHVIRGSSVKAIVPQEAIESLEKVG